MKGLLLFIGLLPYVPLFSQNRKPVVEFCPAAMIDEFSFPTVQGGLELRLSNRISWYNEFGIKYRRAYYERSDTSFIHSQGFKAKMELRYYLLGMQEGKGAHPDKEYYIAANVFFNRNYSNTHIQFHYQQDSSHVISDDFGVKKDVWGMNALFGTQQIIKGHFIFELYGGVGVRVRSVATEHKEYVDGRDMLITAVDINVDGTIKKIDSKDGQSVAPHMTAGIRLGYRF